MERLELPPAGARRLQDEVAERFRWVGGWGAAIPPATDPGKPSRPGPGRQGRTSGGALHLVTLALARSTVCGSAADGMAASRRLGWANHAAAHGGGGGGDEPEPDHRSVASTKSATP